jgi:hypothetical protein
MAIKIRVVVFWIPKTSQRGVTIQKITTGFSKMFTVSIIVHLFGRYSIDFNYLCVKSFSSI